MLLTLAKLSRAGALALAASLATFTLPPVLHAAPPANDTCAGAIVVPGVPYLSPVIDILDATTNGDPVPVPALGELKRSIWFRFVPAASALYTLSVAEDTETKFVDLTDTVMGLYTSASGCGGPWTLVAGNDDSAVVQSAITTNLSAGTPYFIVVWAGQGAQDESLPLYVQLRVTRPVVPANDLCTGAIAVPATTLPYVSPSIDTFMATSAVNEMSSCDGNRSVWFTFAPTVAGTYFLSLDREPATSLLDPIMTLFTSAGGCSGPFTELTCTDSKTHPIIRSLSAGTTYYIVIGDYEPAPQGGATAVQLRVRPAGPPTVTTLPATSINSTSGVLNMAINANGFAARYFFEWGPTTSYGNLSQNRPLNDSSNTVSTSALVGPAPAGTTWHFRAVGSNSMGKVFGADQTFQYSTNRPIITRPSFLAGGNFRFSFMGNTGQVYRIQSKTDMSGAIQWIDSGPALDRGGGLYEFRASGIPVTPGTRRFHRVHSP